MVAAAPVRIASGEQPGRAEVDFQQAFIETLNPPARRTWVYDAKQTGSR